jgi:hypothetical protein
MANMTGFSSVCSTCVTSLAALTSTNIVIGAGLKSESASLATVDSSGNIGTPASVSAGTGSGSTGTITALAGTAPVSPGSGNFSLFFNSANSNHLTIKNSSGTLFDLQNYYPSSGIAVSTGSAWSTSLTTPASALVGISDTQTLTNKSISGGEINSGTVLSTYLPSGILYSGGALGTPSSGNASNLTNFPTLNQNTTGNAATATALASTPSGCTTGQFATAIAASGNLTCGVPGGSGNVVGPVSSTGGYLPQWNGTSGALLSAGLPVGTTGNNTVVETSSGGLISAGIVPTLNQSTSGNAATATYATSAGSATTATTATSATTAGSATTAATASALSAAYIDYNASSGGASIQNKPAAPYGFTTVHNEGEVETALGNGAKQLYIPAGSTWIVKNTQWSYTYGSQITTVPPNSIPPGILVLGQNWITSTIQTNTPGSDILFIGPSSTLQNVNVQNAGCSVSLDAGRNYPSGGLCPTAYYSNQEPRYVGTVTTSGSNVTWISGSAFFDLCGAITSSGTCSATNYPTGLSPDAWYCTIVYGVCSEGALYNPWTGNVPQININGNLYTIAGLPTMSFTPAPTPPATTPPKGIPISGSLSLVSGTPACSSPCYYTFDQYHNFSSNGYTSTWQSNGPASTGISLSGFGGGDVVYAGANGYGQTAVRASTAGGGFQAFLAQRINNGDGFATIDNPTATGGRLFAAETSAKTSGSMLELDQSVSDYEGSDAIRVNLGQLGFVNGSPVQGSFGITDPNTSFLDFINSSSGTSISVYKVRPDGSLLGIATAPSGSCTVNGAWMFTQDGKGTVCLGYTWVTKII